MQNPPVSLPPNKVLVLGGNMNSTLKSWMERLAIHDFMHAECHVTSIAPGNMQLSANMVRFEYGHIEFLFTVGLFADKLVTMAGLPHGALPSTTHKKRRDILASIDECKNYIMRRINEQSRTSLGS